MAEKGRELLRPIYAVPAEKIEVIPHGIPDAPFVGSRGGKAETGLRRQAVILTFGLLSPNKGIEVMIDAMPAILRSRAGRRLRGARRHASQPRARSGRGVSRESRGARARARHRRARRVSRSVRRSSRRCSISSRCAMCTSRLISTRAQMTSGTLAYSFGMGKAVVSTPYWHARELLADGRGVLVPFNDVAAHRQRNRGPADRRRRGGRRCASGPMRAAAP